MWLPGCVSSQNKKKAVWKQCVKSPGINWRKVTVIQWTLLLIPLMKGEVEQQRGGWKFLCLWVVSDICFCGGALRCPPPKRDTSVCLLWGASVFWGLSELCLGRLETRSACPHSLQAEVFLSLHDGMIPLLPQLRPLLMVAMDFGAAPISGSESTGSGVADTTP